MRQEAIHPAIIIFCLNKFIQAFFTMKPGQLHFKLAKKWHHFMSRWPLLSLLTNKKGAFFWRLNTAFNEFNFVAGRDSISSNIDTS